MSKNTSNTAINLGGSDGVARRRRISAEDIPVTPDNPFSAIPGTAFSALRRARIVDGRVQFGTDPTSKLLRFTLPAAGICNSAGVLTKDGKDLVDILKRLAEAHTTEE